MAEAVSAGAVPVEPQVEARCLYAISQDGAIVTDHGGEYIVPWWSFTKTVIAAAALTLVQDGRLRLDGTIDRQPYTLRQLLQHRAGLADYGALPDYHAAVTRGDEPWSVSELLDRVNSDQLLYPPGTGWQYSNVGYLIVRQMIERETDTDLGAALRRLVLKPLGLDDVWLASNSSDLAGVMMGEASSYHPGWVYHGLLVGPVRSAAMSLDRLLGTGLSAVELRQQMLNGHPVGGPIEGRPWKAAGYGLGMICGESKDGHRFAGHTGSGPGSVIAVYRRMNSRTPQSAAAFLTDGTQGQAERAAFDLVSR
jgi:CubicO group peptidase (beta-lactamase class C family)